MKGKPLELGVLLAAVVEPAAPAGVPVSDAARRVRVCARCGVGCDVTLHVQDNEIVKVTSPHDNPVTHGNLCINGRFGFQHVQNRV